MAETMTWYKKVISALVSVGGNSVAHSEHLKKDRYIVWEEDGVNDLKADGKHCERYTRFVVDLFTKNEFDTWKNSIETAFETNDILWEYDGCDYEEETEFYHHSWSCMIYG